MSGDHGSVGTPATGLADAVAALAGGALMLAPNTESGTTAARARTAMARAVHTRSLCWLIPQTKAAKASTTAAANRNSRASGPVCWANTQAK